jgi:hypothetical protein
MQPLNNIYRYWEEAILQQGLFALNGYTINEDVRFINRLELQAGQLSDVSKAHLGGVTEVVVIPICAIKNATVFIPLMLAVTISEEGYFMPSEYNKLPIIPRAALEPSKEPTPIVLGQLADFDKYYSQCAPIWFGVDYEPTWDDQLNYGLEFIAQNLQSNWEEQLRDEGYFIDHESALIIPVNAIVNNYILDSKIINSILNFHDSSMLALDSIDINSIAVLAAERNSGKSRYIADKIMDAWMSSALTQTMPALHVWLASEEVKVNNYANIFDCYPDSQLWLTKSIRQEIFFPQIISDFSLSYCIQNFLSLLSNYLKIDVLHLGDARETLLNILKDNIENLNKTKQQLELWNQLERNLVGGYKDKGGIHNRIRELKQALALVQQEVRHLSAIVSMHNKFDVMFKLPRWLDNIRLLNYLKNRSLYKFYAQYFPDEQISMLSHSALNAKLNAKMHKLQDKEQQIHSLISKCNAELINLEAVKLECKSLFKTDYDCDIETYAQACDFLNIGFVKYLHLITLRYYETIVLDDFSWSKTSNEYSKYFISAPIEEIECLFIEHANYLPTITTLPLLDIAKQVIIFGNEDVIETLVLPTIVDLKLCEAVDLIRHEPDLKELQLNGILASSSNLWQFVTKSKPAINTFNINHDKQRKPVLQYIHVKSNSEEYLGSKCNAKEITELYNIILATYQLYGFNDDWAIYTTFKAQANKIQAMLADTIFASVPIKILQQANLTTYRISLVSTVYGYNDHGPYCFEDQRNNVALNNLIYNTVERVIIVGNESILKVKHATDGLFSQMALS